MAKLEVFIAVALFGGIVTATGFNEFPFFRSSDPQGRQVVFRNARVADQTLPCQFGGFFPHPRNCSQFYRCVDYLETGIVFSRYLYHCPYKHVFVSGLDTCVPGICSEAGSLPIVRPTTPRPVSSRPVVSGPVTNRPVVSGPVTNRPVVSGPISNRPVVSGPVTNRPVVSGPITSRPVVSGPMTSRPVVSGPSTNRPVVSGPVTSRPLATQPMKCRDGEYEQHAKYCNVYQPCGDSSVHYACDEGSVFDQKRQMCTVHNDETICNGKGNMRVNTIYSALSQQDQPSSGAHRRVNPDNQVHQYSQNSGAHRRVNPDNQVHQYSQNSGAHRRVNPDNQGHQYSQNPFFKDRFNQRQTNVDNQVHHYSQNPFFKDSFNQRLTNVNSKLINTNQHRDNHNQRNSQFAVVKEENQIEMIDPLQDPQTPLFKQQPSNPLFQPFEQNQQPNNLPAHPMQFKPQFNHQNQQYPLTLNDLPLVVNSNILPEYVQDPYYKTLHPVRSVSNVYTIPSQFINPKRTTVFK